MAGAGSEWRLEGSRFCEEACGGVDAENADEVGAQVGNDDEGVCGVDERFVGMGGILPVGDSAWLRQGKGEFL